MRARRRSSRAHRISYSPTCSCLGFISDMKSSHVNRAWYSRVCARGFFFFQAEDGIRDPLVIGVQTCALPIFATVIMALLAIPFAVTTGRRGAMYGIGIGIALSIGYWVILNVFSAIGEGGVLTPTIAAWAPNLLFGAAALYGILTVRT